MTLSRQLLELMEALDYPPAVSVSLLHEEWEDIVERGHYISHEERRDSHESRRLFRALIKRTVRSRLAPSPLSPEQVAQELNLPKDVSTAADRALDGLLDDYFTIKALNDVRNTVRRWKALERLSIGRVPEAQRVADYVRQATTCYLYGFHEAAAVLCRSVLEFALFENLAARRTAPGFLGCLDSYESSQGIAFTDRRKAGSSSSGPWEQGHSSRTDPGTRSPGADQENGPTPGATLQRTLGDEAVSSVSGSSVTFRSLEASEAPRA